MMTDQKLDALHIEIVEIHCKMMQRMCVRFRTMYLDSYKFCAIENVLCVI